LSNKKGADRPVPLSQLLEQLAAEPGGRRALEVAREELRFHSARLDRCGAIYDGLIQQAIIKPVDGPRVPYAERFLEVLQAMATPAAAAPYGIYATGFRFDVDGHEVYLRFDGTADSPVPPTPAAARANSSSRANRAYSALVEDAVRNVAHSRHLPQGALMGSTRLLLERMLELAAEAPIKVCPYIALEGGPAVDVDLSPSLAAPAVQDTGLAL